MTATKNHTQGPSARGTVRDGAPAFPAVLRVPALVVRTHAAVNATVSVRIRSVAAPPLILRTALRIRPFTSGSTNDFPTCRAVRPSVFTNLSRSTTVRIRGFRVGSAMRLVATFNWPQAYRNQVQYVCSVAGSGGDVSMACGRDSSHRGCPHSGLP